MGGGTEGDDLLPDLRRAAEGGSARSRLGRWFRTNKVGFAQLLEEYGSAWEPFAKLFIERGLLDAPAGYGQEGEVGKRALERAANSVKQSWFRQQKKRPKWLEAAAAATPPASGGGLDGQQNLQRLRDTMKQRSGR